MRSGLGQLALLHQDFAKTVVSGIKVRSAAQRIFYVIRSLSQIALGSKNLTQPVMGIDEFRIEPERAFMVKPSLGEISEFGQHNSEIVLGERVPGVESDGPFQMGFCLRQVVLFV